MENDRDSFKSEKLSPISVTRRTIEISKNEILSEVGISMIRDYMKKKNEKVIDYRSFSFLSNTNIDQGVSSFIQAALDIIPKGVTTEIEVTVRIKKDLPKLRESLDEILMQYIIAFSKKQGLEFESSVDDGLMSTLYFGDIFYFYISDVIYDVDNNVEKGLICQWLDNTMKSQREPIEYPLYHKGLRYEH